jgi:hypothetical protein
MPALDAAHSALLQAFRIEARNPSRAPQLDFGPMVVRGMMRRWRFPDDVMHAVVWKEIPGTSQPPRFHHPAQIKAVRDALVAEGLVVPAQTDTYGRVKAWAYAPVAPFPTREAYEAAIAQLVAPPPVPVPVPAPRRLRSLTGTRWTFLDASRQFASKFPGTDALTGLPFNAGDLIVMASLAQGEKQRPVSVRGMRLIDLREAGDGVSVTNYTFVTPDVDTDDLVARADSFTTLTKTGSATNYKRSTTPGSPWIVNGLSSRTEAQARANARKAFAISALGYE